MSDKRDDDYIDKYTNEVPTMLTDREMYGPLVYGGIAILMLIAYFAALAIGDMKLGFFIILVPFTAFRGLIWSYKKRLDRFSYLLFWRLGFYSCAVSLAVSIGVISLILLHIIPFAIK